jgi:hypothetical protein
MTSNERTVLRAFCQKRIAEYQGDEKNAIQAKLWGIALDLGIKQSIEPDALKRLTVFLIEKYPKMTVESLGVAFDMALAKEFDVNTDHFQSFDKKYVATILNAYKSHQNKVVKKASDEADRIERENERKAASQRQKSPEYQKQMYEGLLKYVQEKNEMPDAWNFNACYHHMRKNGLITESVDKLRAFMEQVKQRVQIELNTAKIEQNKVSEARCMRILNSEDGIKAHWRAEYVKEYFKSILN